MPVALRTCGGNSCAKRSPERSTGKDADEALERAGIRGIRYRDAMSRNAPAMAYPLLRADGSIVARRDRSGLFSGGFESIQVMPGDTVVVPAQIDRESRYNMVTRAFKDWTQILSNFGLGVAAINSISKL